MESTIRNAIRGKASALLMRIWGKPATGLDMVPVDLRRILEEIDVNLEEPEEIWESPNSTASTRGYLVEGYLDRDPANPRIIVARNASPERRRYTMAHEIGHYILHRDRTSRRHRKVSVENRVPLRRSLKEREADEFAAALLMPENFLREMFISYYGGALHVAPHDSDKMWLLSAGAGRKVDLASMNTSKLSYMAATNTMYGIKHFPASLASRFKVSAAAMAIELERQGFVRLLDGK